MLKNVRNIIIVLFVLSVFVFATIALLGIWDVIDSDLVWKSIATLCVIVFSAASVLGIVKAILDKKAQK